MKVDKLLKLMVEKGASDLHLMVSSPSNVQKFKLMITRSID